MTRLPKLTPRQILIVLHDLAVTAAAIVLTFFIRFEGQPLDERLPGLKFLPVFLAYAAAVYFIFNLHRNKWRFTSIPDLYNIFRAVTVLAVSLLALDYVLVAPNVYGTFFFGKIPSCCTGSCRCFCSAARASPTAISITRVRSSVSKSPMRHRR